MSKYSSKHRDQKPSGIPLKSLPLSERLMNDLDTDKLKRHKIKGPPFYLVSIPYKDILRQILNKHPYDLYLFIWRRAAQDPDAAFDLEVNKVSALFDKARRHFEYLHMVKIHKYDTHKGYEHVAWGDWKITKHGHKIAEAWEEYGLMDLILSLPREIKREIKKFNQAIWALIYLDPPKPLTYSKYKSVPVYTERLEDSAGAPIGEVTLKGAKFTKKNLQAVSLRLKCPRCSIEFARELDPAEYHDNLFKGKPCAIVCPNCKSPDKDTEFSFRFHLNLVRVQRVPKKTPLRKRAPKKAKLPPSRKAKKRRTQSSRAIRGEKKIKMKPVKPQDARMKVPSKIKKPSVRIEPPKVPPSSSFVQPYENIISLAIENTKALVRHREGFKDSCYREANKLFNIYYPHSSDSSHFFQLLDEKLERLVGSLVPEKKREIKVPNFPDKKEKQRLAAQSINTFQRFLEDFELEKTQIREAKEEFSQLISSEVNASPKKITKTQFTNHLEEKLQWAQHAFLEEVRYRQLEQTIENHFSQIAYWAIHKCIGEVLTENLKEMRKSHLKTRIMKEFLEFRRENWAEFEANTVYRIFAAVLEQSFESLYQTATQKLNESKGWLHHFFVTEKIEFREINVYRPYFIQILKDLGTQKMAKKQFLTSILNHPDVAARHFSRKQVDVPRFYFKMIKVARRELTFGGYSRVVCLFAEWNCSFQENFGKNISKMVRNMILKRRVGEDFPLNSWKDLVQYYGTWNAEVEESKIPKKREFRMGFIDLVRQALKDFKSDILKREECLQVIRMVDKTVYSPRIRKRIEELIEKELYSE